MDFRESLEFLYGLQHFGIKLGLDNTRQLLDRAGHPERGYRTVHVAGTNGKGSVCAMLAEILRCSGLRVGLYTSPHLQSFPERIRIDGMPLATAEVAELTEELRRLAPRIPATFFEFTTVMAFLAFARHRVDVAVVETGLGGRFDATNVLTPALTVITPVSLDHQDHLGPSLSAIAAEKAGIIKPHTPVVIGRQPPAALSVLREQAQACNAPLYRLGHDFTLEEDGNSPAYHGLGEELPRLEIGLAGMHQRDNAALALTAALLLREQGVAIDAAALRQGIAQAHWPGRLEWLGGDPRVLLDGAHNEDGARVLADYLAPFAASGIHWVAGIKNDKNYLAILDRLLPLSSALYAVAPPGVTAIDPQQLAAAASTQGVPAQAFPSVATALRAAQSACTPQQIVLVAGSLFLVGAARDLLLTVPERP